jgi:hypothetical protein
LKERKSNKGSKKSFRILNVNQLLIIFLVLAATSLRNYLVVNAIGLTFFVIGFLTLIFMFIYFWNAGHSDPIKEASKKKFKFGLLFNYIPIRKKYLILWTAIGIGFIFLGFFFSRFNLSVHG